MTDAHRETCREQWRSLTFRQIANVNKDCSSAEVLHLLYNNASKLQNPFRHRL